MSYKNREATDYLVVHASATPPSMYIGADEIDRWHRERGWLGIGYHFVITREGRWEQGRPMNVMGAHVRGYNDRSLGICLVGGVAERPATKEDSKADQRRGYVPLMDEPEENYTDAQFDALSDLLLMLEPHYPDAQVVGHSDLDSNKPNCPGFYVPDWVTQRGL